jgi:iron-sulfur cluster assembly protein
LLFCSYNSEYIKEKKYMFSVSESAKKRLKDLMTEEGVQDTHFLRVSVKGGGCAGFSYELDFDDKLEPGDEEVTDGDIKIVIDRRSILYVFGTELDWSGGLNGKGFEWKNPNATRTCSCGTSFSA